MILFLFILTYAGVAAGGIPRLAIDRTGVALLGAIAMTAVRAISPEEALDAIHFPALLLLYGLMILSAQLRMGGFYTWLALNVTQWSERPATFLLALMLTGGLLSPLLANDIICLAFTPVLCIGLRRRNLNPVPFLLGLAMSTNLGSAATLIGNPQTMLIAEVFDLGFTDYLLWCAPPSLLALFATYGMLCLLFRNQWTTVGESPAPPEPDWPPLDRWQTLKGLLATLLLVLLLILNQPRVISALVIAGLLLLSRKMHTRKMLALVDWHLITLFSGLFIVVRAFYLSGLPEQILAGLAGHGIQLDTPHTLTLTAVLLSNLVSNVPATLLLLEPLAEASRETAYLLALSTTYAGNLLPLGSLANLIVLEQAKTCGIRIRFRDYARAGIPVTLLNLCILLLWAHFRMG
jgi:Na+/H+ antiporter NhaD/arsenite permease-like protein